MQKSRIQKSLITFFYTKSGNKLVLSMICLSRE